MSLQIIAKNSAVSGKEPTAGQLANGELALNYHADGPFITCKDTAGVIRRVAGVWISATAPATPAPGEFWLDINLSPAVLKIYKDSTDTWIAGTTVVAATTTTAGIAQLATNSETQTGSDTNRAVTPAGLQSKLSDSTSTTSSTTIASSTAAKAAYDLAALALPKTGGTITGNLEIGTTGTLSFEGATADAFETAIAVVDPTADRTITLPNVTGTVVTTGDTGTITSTMLLDGTLLNADINTSAAIADTKLATISTALKVSNSATTATSANTPSAIVARDASNNFTAGTITAALAGNASTVTTNANLTGDVTSVGNATSIASGVIVNADVNASAAIAGTKISPDFGTQNIVTTGSIKAANTFYNRRPPLTRGSLFTKTAATTLSVIAGAVFNGQYYASATAVTMPSHSNNTDYAIWQHPTTGALVGDASFTTAPGGATGGTIVGGYHYIPSGRPTAFNNGSPTSSAEILEYSIWDLTWRPTCPDPRGMTCIDGRFWCDMYFCGKTSYAGTTFSAVPSSKIGLTIADNYDPALIPSFYGGDGSTAYSAVGTSPVTYAGSWYNFMEVAHSFGKRFMWTWEFQAAAFGVAEASSRGTDAGTVIWERASKWGLAQATGTMRTWAAERIGVPGSTLNNTGNRGTVSTNNTYDNVPYMGGVYFDGTYSGSRAVTFYLSPGGASSEIAARFACEHALNG